MVAHLNIILVNYNYLYLSDISFAYCVPSSTTLFYVIAFLRFIFPFHRFTKNKNLLKKIATRNIGILSKCPQTMQQHMTDVSTQESITNNNEIPADSSSLQIQPIANSVVPKIFQGLNERHILIL